MPPTLLYHLGKLNKTQGRPTEILTMRTQHWTRAEYIEPGRIARRDKQTEFYCGSVDDCDVIAEAKGVLTMIDEIPAPKEASFHSRVHLEPNKRDTRVRLSS